MQRRATELVAVIKVVKRSDEGAARRRLENALKNLRTSYTQVKELAQGAAQAAAKCEVSCAVARVLAEVGG